MRLLLAAWLFLPSYYTHHNGRRVYHYERPPVTQRGDYHRGGYRQVYEGTRVGDTFESSWYWESWRE